MGTERRVELKTAYHWHCEECGRENFDLPSKAEMTDEDREDAFRKFHELDEWVQLPEGWKQFEMVWIPDYVTCVHCGETFGTVDERLYDGD